MNRLRNLFGRGAKQQPQTTTTQAAPVSTTAAPAAMPAATQAPTASHAAPSPNVGPDPTQLVQDAVSSHKVTVFSKSFCPFCKKAKETLSSMVQPSDMFVMELDQRADGAAIQQVLSGITGSSSVPKVFIGGKFIGGGDDTVAKAANGELAQLLRAA